MSKQVRRTNGQERKPLPPLVTASDVGRSGRTAVELDGQIGTMLEEHARRRAPSRHTTHRHLVGAAGELAVAAWQGVPMDRRVFADYEGDDGYDLNIPLRGHGKVPTEVKTTTELRSPEQTVSSGELETADLFILCATDTPKRRVEIVGWAPERLARTYGDVYGCANGEYLLSPQFCYPVSPTQVTPDRIRDTQYRR